MTNKEKRLRMKAELKNLTPKLELAQILRKANPQPLPSKPMRKSIWGAGLAGVFATFFLVLLMIYGLNNTLMDKSLKGANPDDSAAEYSSDQERLFGFVGVSVVYLVQQSYPQSDQSFLNRDLLIINTYVSIFDTYRMINYSNHFQKTASQRVGYQYRLELISSKNESFVIHYNSEKLLVEAKGIEYAVQFSKKSNQFEFTYVKDDKTFHLKGTGLDKLIIESNVQYMNGVMTTVEWENNVLFMERKSALSTQNFKINSTASNDTEIAIEFEDENHSKPGEGLIYGKIYASGTQMGYHYKGYIGERDLEETIPD